MHALNFKLGPRTTFLLLRTAPGVRTRCAVPDRGDGREQPDGRTVGRKEHRGNGRIIEGKRGGDSLEE